MIKSKIFILMLTLLVVSGCSDDDTKSTDESGHGSIVSDEVIAGQRTVLAESIVGKSVGAQSPRDIDSVTGDNILETTTAPASTAMNLCNIHFHINAEHKGGEFTTYAGNGNGEGYNSGYKYSGTLTESESEDKGAVCINEHSSLYAGDTIEVHYVYSSDDVQPGATLGACLATDRAEGTQPLLRVETQVYVVVNDETALDFGTLTQTLKDATSNFYQAPNIPSNTGTAVQYEGSTTGPGYNEKVSPLQVTWNVRPNVAKVSIGTVGTWCEGNVFDETYGHGVRNLLINPALLSEIQ